MKTSKIETLVGTVSVNANSFGYHNVIAIAQDGRAWDVLWSAHVPGRPVPKRGAIVTLDIDETGSGLARGGYVATPRPPVPALVLEELWGDMLKVKAFLEAGDTYGRALKRARKALEEAQFAASEAIRLAKTAEQREEWTLESALVKASARVLNPN